MRYICWCSNQQRSIGCQLRHIIISPVFTHPWGENPKKAQHPMDGCCEEKWQIKALLASGQSLRSIALLLGRSVSTIFHEKKRGFISDGYSPTRSQECYRHTRKKSGISRQKLQGRLWQDVRDCLHLCWSPEQISGRFRAIGLAEVSHATIYAQIYRTKSAGLLCCLRHGGKKYAYGRSGKSLIPDRADISERPEIVEQKQRLGDWEGDTIVGAGHKGAIVSLVDRASAQHPSMGCCEI